MSKGIRLSEKHGVNPAIPLCFYCLKPKNEIILAGKLPGDAEAPNRVVWDHAPCDTCAGYMKRGIILISTREDSGDNPYRTGGWVVVSEDFVRRMLNPETAETLCVSRMSFVPDDAWDKLALPRGPVEGVPTE